MLRTTLTKLNLFLQKKSTIFAILLLAMMFILEITSSFTETQTIDEGVHLVAGWSYLKNLKIELNLEHPPLLKILQALPLFFLNPDLPRGTEQWSLAQEFLYHNRVPAENLLFAGRLVTIILSLFLGWAIFKWAGETSATRGLLALFFYVFDSNILAHSHYITTDIGLTLFYFLTIFFLKKYCATNQSKFLFLTALFFALAQVSKFSAILLIPTILILGLLEKISFRRYLKVIYLCFLFSTVLIFLLYFFNPTNYFEGLKLLKSHAVFGHSTYLLGTASKIGWWYYFPLAFLFKTSPVILILLLVAWLANLRRFPKYIFVPVIIYFVASLFVHINIGIRHIIPIFPLLYVFIAQSIPKFKPAVILLIFYFYETLAIYPNFLAYFSPLFGGTNQGHFYLLDSNLDWGQDLGKLKKYLEKNKIKEKIYLASYGQASPSYYQINYFPYQGEYVRGYIAISLTFLYHPYFNQSYQWLLSFEPIAKIGRTIYLYKIP